MWDSRPRPDCIHTASRESTCFLRVPGRRVLERVPRDWERMGQLSRSDSTCSTLAISGRHLLVSSIRSAADGSRSCHWCFPFMFEAVPPHRVQHAMQDRVQKLGPGDYYRVVRIARRGCGSAGSVGDRVAMPRLVRRLVTAVSHGTQTIDGGLRHGLRSNDRTAVGSVRAR